VVQGPALISEADGSVYDGSVYDGSVYDGSVYDGMMARCMTPLIQEYISAHLVGGRLI
jgi:hypothetical protein